MGLGHPASDPSNYTRNIIYVPPSVDLSSKKGGLMQFAARNPYWFRFEIDECATATHPARSIITVDLCMLFITCVPTFLPDYNAPTY